MAKRLSWKAVVTAAVSLAAIPVFMATRGYPWQLAVPASGAIGVLVYLALSTVQKSLTGVRRGEGKSERD
jgi:hypothetical protein